ncbi:MAG: peptide deformylase [bacterium]
MAVQEIIELGNPILREKSTEIDNVLSPETQQIITDLMDTLNSSPVPGV